MLDEAALRDIRMPDKLHNCDVMIREDVSTSLDSPSAARLTCFQYTADHG